MPMLEIERINTYYGRIHALKDVSLHVDKGEIVTLIGANGAGKSTALNTICGLLKPREGSIRFDGEDLVPSPPTTLSSRVWCRFPREDGFLAG